jgi:hypothetical protein
VTARSGGVYQHADEDLLRIWQAGVEEVPRAPRRRLVALVQRQVDEREPDDRSEEEQRDPEQRESKRCCPSPARGSARRREVGLGARRSCEHRIERHRDEQRARYASE